MTSYKHLVDRPTQLSGWRLAACITTLAAVIYTSVVQLPGVDFWLQAKIGEMIAQTGKIPDTLLFSFTEIAAEKFNAHEWLASMLFHFALVAFGADGMPFFAGGLGVILFFASAWLAWIRSEGNAAIALLGGTMTCAVQNYRHTLRPELLSMVLMALFWACAERMRKYPSVKTVLPIAILQILWANTHGSFILGPIVLCVMAVGSSLDAWRDNRRPVWQMPPETRGLYLTIGLALLCCLVNPFGIELLLFAIGFGARNSLNQTIAEWMPTFDQNFLQLRGLWIAVVAWCSIAAVLVIQRRRVRIVDLLVLLFFTAMAVKAIRFPVYIGLVWAFIVPAYVPQSWKSVEVERKFLKAVAAFGVTLLGFAMIFGNAAKLHPYTDGGRTKLTAQMIQALANPSVHGNVLNSMELGAELVYLTYPRLRPSIDCRLDSYGLEYFNYTDELLRNDDLLREFVARYDVRYVLIDLTRFEWFKRLASWKNDRWRIVSIDHKAVFLQRSDTL